MNQPLIPPGGVRFTALGPSAGTISAPRPALFLDRDGVLVEEAEYLHRVEDLALLPGAAELIAAARASGLAVALVSNQSGIARGMYGWDAYDAVEAEIDRRLAAVGAVVDARAACCFHPDHTPGWGKTHEFWRKPGPGMLLLAAQALGADPARSWMVGDMATDAAAARAAGLAGSIHVATGHGPAHRAAALEHAAPGFEVVPVPGLDGALAALRQRGVLR